MKINIRTKGITLTNNVQEYIEKKLLTLEKYYNPGDSDSCQTYVSIEKNTAKDGANVSLDVRVSIGKKTFIAEEKASTIEECTDLAHDKLKTQLQRSREKMKDRHVK